jgi:hypothetical protein
VGIDWCKSRPTGIVHHDLLNKLVGLVSIHSSTRVQYITGQKYLLLALMETLDQEKGRYPGSPQVPSDPDQYAHHFNGVMAVSGRLDSSVKHYLL